MTAEVIALRADDACRAAAMARHPAGKALGTCPPHAALLHRIASMVTMENLPEAHVSVCGRDVLVDCTNCELVENAVRRWAVALDLIVTAVPVTRADGATGQQWDASGWDGTGAWWHVFGQHVTAAGA